MVLMSQKTLISNPTTAFLIVHYSYLHNLYMEIIVRLLLFILVDPCKSTTHEPQFQIFHHNVSVSFSWHSWVPGFLVLLGWITIVNEAFGISFRGTGSGGGLILEI